MNVQLLCGGQLAVSLEFGERRQSTARVARAGLDQPRITHGAKIADRMAADSPSGSRRRAATEAAC